MKGSRWMGISTRGRLGICGRNLSRVCENFRIFSKMISDSIIERGLERKHTEAGSLRGSCCHSPSKRRRSVDPHTARGLDGVKRYLEQRTWSSVLKGGQKWQ